MLITSLLSMLDRQREPLRLKPVGKSGNSRRNAEEREFRGIPSGEMRESGEGQAAAAGAVPAMLPEPALCSADDTVQVFDRFVRVVCYFDGSPRRPNLDIFE